MEARCVLDGHPADEHALAALDADHVLAQGFFAFRPVGDVADVLEVVREPQLAFVGLGAAELLEVFPFLVAQLGALGISPVFAVAVDDAAAGDADVGAFFRADAGQQALVEALVREIRRFFLGEDDYRAFLHVQVDPAPEPDGAGEPDALRHDHVAAVRQGLDGFVERGGAHRDPVAYCTELLDAYACVGNLRQRRLFQLYREVLIKGRDVLRGECVAGRLRGGGGTLCGAGGREQQGQEGQYLSHGGEDTQIARFLLPLLPCPSSGPAARSGRRALVVKW